MTGIMMFRLILFYAALSIPGLLGKAMADPGKLDLIASDLEASFPDIGHLSAAHFADMAEQDDGIILVDVRREAEYAVSHIKGAMRISPRASAMQVAEAIGPNAANKSVIFYCSVGVRSSKLADKSKDALQAIGAREIYNLSGGIFAWHNESRPLVDESGATDLVHPYDRNWGKLLARQGSVAMRPERRYAQ